MVQTAGESPGYRPNLLALTCTGYLISRTEGIKAHKIHSQTYFGQFLDFVSRVAINTYRHCDAISTLNLQLQYLFP